MMLSTEAKHFGIGAAVVATAIPDWLLSGLEKVGLALVIAVVSGFGYALGTAIWNRIKK
jgi:hypothetical protein